MESMDIEERKDGMENMDGMDGDTCLRHAYDAILHGDFEAAVHWFGQAIEWEPDNASYYYKASITCARSGKSALAEMYAKRAVELAPGDPDYALNLRTIEARRLLLESRMMLERSIPDAAQAKQLLLEAEKLDPLLAEAKLLLGIASRMLGDLRTAIAYIRDTLSLDPQHAEACRLLREYRAERRRKLRSQLKPPKSYRNR
ncbi:tetratricopeptide repeat protein [Cohnella sp. CFH 77786]|uniref:tetratricopeptide repeat protein n=1 Tax=Cohnella sp. CFH 77786 TaxID=2662265 RepID=UPI001C608D02|nr:tetratricopeptide repeat protein [Cohnella sp. CFH 77786]